MVSKATRMVLETAQLVSSGEKLVYAERREVKQFGFHLNPTAGSVFSCSFPLDLTPDLSQTHLSTQGLIASSL